jgi:hypothetical protein
MKIKVHKSITEARVLEAVESEMFGLENPGFCLSCGEDADGCEPDARNYTCEACDAQRVYGASELLIMGAYHRG